MYTWCPTTTQMSRLKVGSRLILIGKVNCLVDINLAECVASHRVYRMYAHCCTSIFSTGSLHYVELWMLLPNFRLPKQTGVPVLEAATVAVVAMSSAKPTTAVATTTAISTAIYASRFIVRSSVHLKMVTVSIVSTIVGDKRLQVEMSDDTIAS